MGDFYCRFYVGHKGHFGHEYMEVELFSDGRLKYANNSNYKKDTMIRKEAKVSSSVVEEFKKIIRDAEVTSLDDSAWPEPNESGAQELEVKLDSHHVSFTCSKLGSLSECIGSKDPEGLRSFYYFTQDLKSLVFSLIAMHFKIKPIP